MNYSKLMESSRQFSAYEELSGGVNAWGLGGLGVVRRGGFGSGGALGGVSIQNLSMNARAVFDGDSQTAASANNYASWVDAFDALNRGALYYPVGYMKAVGGSSIASVQSRAA